MLYHSLNHPRIPDWLREHINLCCPECGSPIVNNLELTDRFCLNPDCIGHMAPKIVSLAKFFNIKGIGLENAKSIVKLYKLKTHLAVIPLWFGENKPSLKLYEIAKLTYMKGYQDKWEKMLDGFSSLTEFADSSTCPLDLKLQRVKWEYADNYFIVQRDMSAYVFHVMLHGSFKGYSNREDFIADVNKRFNRFAEVRIVKTARQSSVDFFISEEGERSGRKFEAAIKGGVSIVTPDEFYKYLVLLSTFSNEEVKT